MMLSCTGSCFFFFFILNVQFVWLLVLKLFVFKSTDIMSKVIILTILIHYVAEKVAISLSSPVPYILVILLCN